MTYKIFRHIFSFFTLFLFLGCSLSSTTQAPNPNQEIRKKSNTQGWSNYYYGVTPCASCPGIETWLLLKHAQKKNCFNLVENYLEEQNGVFTTKGSFTLQNNMAKLISKSNQSYLYINNNSVSFVKSPTDSIKKEFTLERLEDFKDKTKIVLVIPKSVKQSSNNGKKSIEFDALTNFNLITPHGNKSLKAHYIVGCNAQKSYTISKGIYYKNPFATGITKPYKNQNMVNFQGKNDAIRQVQGLYCK